MSVGLPEGPRITGILGVMNLWIKLFFWINSNLEERESQNHNHTQGKVTSSHHQITCINMWTPWRHEYVYQNFTALQSIAVETFQRWLTATAVSWGNVFTGVSSWTWRRCRARKVSQNLLGCEKTIPEDANKMSHFVLLQMSQCVCINQ